MNRRLQWPDQCHTRYIQPATKQQTSKRKPAVTVQRAAEIQRERSKQACRPQLTSGRLDAILPTYTTVVLATSASARAIAWVGGRGRTGGSGAGIGGIMGRGGIIIGGRGIIIGGGMPAGRSAEVFWGCSRWCCSASTGQQRGNVPAIHEGRQQLNGAEQLPVNVSCIC